MKCLTSHETRIIGSKINISRGKFKWLTLTLHWVFNKTNLIRRKTCWYERGPYHTGAPNFSEPIQGGAKLVAVDLSTNTIRRVYTFIEDVVLPTTYLNDVRFDFRVGKIGFLHVEICLAYVFRVLLVGPLSAR